MAWFQGDPDPAWEAAQEAVQARADEARRAAEIERKRIKTPQELAEAERVKREQSLQALTRNLSEIDTSVLTSKGGQLKLSPACEEKKVPEVVKWFAAYGWSATVRTVSSRDPSSFHFQAPRTAYSEITLVPLGA